MPLRFTLKKWPSAASQVLQQPDAEALVQQHLDDEMLALQLQEEFERDFELEDEAREQQEYEAQRVADEMVAAESEVKARAADSDEQAVQAWNNLGGSMLEAALIEDEVLGGAPVRLVDARYLVQIFESGERISRRQDLPEEAFINLEALQRLGSFMTGLPVAVVSHPWLEPSHPDPHRDNLRLLGPVLRAALEQAKDFGTGTFGVFLDYMSLTQKGLAGEEREPNEAALFREALRTMTGWYSHAKTVVKLTVLPPNYPEGFNFPDGSANTASYEGRGWCFCESSVSNLSKSSDLVLDLGKLVGDGESLEAHALSSKSPLQASSQPPPIDWRLGRASSNPLPHPLYPLRVSPACLLLRPGEAQHIHAI